MYRLSHKSEFRILIFDLNSYKYNSLGRLSMDRHSFFHLKNVLNSSLKILNTDLNSLRRSYTPCPRAYNIGVHNISNGIIRVADCIYKSP